MKRHGAIDRDNLSKKIEKMYRNYGIDTSDMTEDEFSRMKKLYLDGGKSIDKDLKDSEQYKERFADDIV